MRRQNSEDTSQFQYLSGDQLLASNHPQHRPAAILQDRHFRRAGSQPAPSTSTLYKPLEAHRLQVGSGGSTATNAGGHNSAFMTSLANITTGTSSTSSGVSSTSSHNHNHNHNHQLTNPQTPSPPTSTSTSSSSGGVRRHLSAYSLRRATAEVPVPVPAQAQQTNKSAKQGQNNKNGSNYQRDSWASKIKRSATTVNQSDFSSYLSSRYRFRRDQPTSNSKQIQKKSPTQPLTSSYLEQKQLQQQNNMVSSRMVHESEPMLMSSNASGSRRQQQYSDNDDDDNLMVAASTSGVDEDEDTSNDIYSTPNDSIQSVPSTAPVISNENSSLQQIQQHQQQQQRQNQVQYPITKSFSTSNFSHLLQQNQKQQQKFTPIHEQQQQTGAETDRNNLAAAAASKQTDSSRRLNSSSRFFISSSSSEDSNHQSTCQNMPLNTTAAGGQNNSAASSINCNENQITNDQQNNQPALEQHYHKVAIQQGVHTHHQYNGLTVQRPDSLLLVRTQPYPMPVSLLTPAACRGLALPLVAANASASAAATANSPLDCMPITQLPVVVSQRQHNSSYLNSGYRKSPSLFEISSSNAGQHQLPVGVRNLSSRFSSKYPTQMSSSSRQVLGNVPLDTANSSFRPASSKVAPSRVEQNNEEVSSQDQQMATRVRDSVATSRPTSINHQPTAMMPNSISLHDCKLSNYHQPKQQQQQKQIEQSNHLRNDLGVTNAAIGSEYRLAQMLLECGSNPGAKDENGFTALMHAVLSDNLAAIKCLLEHGANLNDANHLDHTALDLLCSRQPTRGRLEILKLLIDNRVDLDRSREGDGTRLLDRLIDEHHQCSDKLPFIEYLLQSGAKLGSSTWLAAYGKPEIQLRLLQKLCQDGYFLYKKSSIEAAVYRFEYALRRLAELEQQLATTIGQNYSNSNNINLLASQQQQQQFIPLASRQIKYQTYLGLSRCERKRKFFKRALEFAHLAILVDSTSYEGYYSKAHILKDLGETDDALLAIDQTQRLVVKTIESLELELNNLQQQEEALIFDGCFNMLQQDPIIRRSNWFESSRNELNGTLEYMQEAKRFVSKLKAEIMDDKLKNATTSSSCPIDGIFNETTTFSTSQTKTTTITKPIAT